MDHDRRSDFAPVGKPQDYVRGLVMFIVLIAAILPIAFVGRALLPAWRTHQLWQSPSSRPGSLTCAAAASSWLWTAARRTSPKSWTNTRGRRLSKPLVAQALTPVLRKKAERALARGDRKTVPLLEAVLGAQRLAGEFPRSRLLLRVR